VAEGQKLFTKNGGQNVDLTFGFDKTHPIQDTRALARKIADLGRRVEHGANWQVRKDVYKDIPELGFVYLYARELQYGDEHDPKFPNGAPDLSEGFTVWADFRNRRYRLSLVLRGEARVCNLGIFSKIS
jgi:hypothetical protein